MLLGGNVDKTCFIYRIENDDWEKQGRLPAHHQALDPCTCVYNDCQVISITCDLACYISNYSYKLYFVSKLREYSMHWETLAMDLLRIQMLQVISAVFIENNLVVMIKGMPSKEPKMRHYLSYTVPTKETKSSTYLLAYPVMASEGQFFGLNHHESSMIKLDYRIFPCKNTPIFVHKIKQDTYLRFYQGTPSNGARQHQLVEIRIPYTDFKSDCSSDEWRESNIKIIDLVCK